METKISGSLVFLVIAKLMWQCAKMMCSGINNLCPTYDLHQIFFSLNDADLSLENYYTKFCSVCKELDLAEPVSVDISVIYMQRDSMHIARFLVLMF